MSTVVEGGGRDTQRPSVLIREPLSHKPCSKDPMSLQYILYLGGKKCHLTLREVKGSVGGFLRGGIGGGEQGHSKGAAQIPDSEEPVEGYGSKSSPWRVQQCYHCLNVKGRSRLSAPT